MLADGLREQGARTSAAILLTVFITEYSSLGTKTVNQRLHLLSAHRLVDIPSVCGMMEWLFTGYWSWHPGQEGWWRACCVWCGKIWCIKAEVSLMWIYHWSSGCPYMHWKPRVVITMMTSSNGNIFRVTGPLCGEFTGHRWIPRTKASDAELWCSWGNNGDGGDLRCLDAHYDVTVMVKLVITGDIADCGYGQLRNRPDDAWQLNKWLIFYIRLFMAS